MKAIKTVSALSNEAFERKLDDAIFLLENSGSRVMGVQSNSGLFHSAVIFYEDNLQYEQRSQDYDFRHGKLMVIGNALLNLSLLALALWILPKYLLNTNAQGRAVMVVGLVAISIVILEMLNTLFDISIRWIAVFCVVVVIVFQILRRFFFLVWPIWVPMFVAVGVVTVSMVLLKDVPNRFRIWYQTVHRGNARYKE